jgi:hypothetical protein
LVFNKQFILSSNQFYYLTKNNGKDINEKAFESVLKKCPNIKSLDIYSENLNEKTLKLITKYCLRLNEIHFYINGINEETVRQFGEKCGQKLKKFVSIIEKTIEMITNTRL